MTGAQEWEITAIRFSGAAELGATLDSLLAR